MVLAGPSMVSIGVTEWSGEDKKLLRSFSVILVAEEQLTFGEPGDSE
jgi:hypothetical protein